jgi:hypothetical protein
LAIASGKCGRDGLVGWIRSHAAPLKK